MDWFLYDNGLRHERRLKEKPFLENVYMLRKCSVIPNGFSPFRNWSLLFTSSKVSYLHPFLISSKNFV